MAFPVLFITIVDLPKILENYEFLGRTSMHVENMGPI